MRIGNRDSTKLIDKIQFFFLLAHSLGGMHKPFGQPWGRGVYEMSTLLKAILSHKSDEIQLSLGLAGSFECLFLL